MSGNLSETQSMLIRLEGKLDALNGKVEEIADNTKDYPITKHDVEIHAKHHAFHFKDISEIKSDINKAKGWAAGIGALTGFLASFFTKH